MHGIDGHARLYILEGALLYGPNKSKVELQSKTDFHAKQ